MLGICVIYIVTHKISIILNKLCLRNMPYYAQTLAISWTKPQNIKVGAFKSPHAYIQNHIMLSSEQECSMLDYFLQ